MYIHIKPDENQRSNDSQNIKHIIIESSHDSMLHCI